VILNQLDLGGSHPYATPVVGQDTFVIQVEGYEPTIYSHGSVDRRQSVIFWLQEWQAIGGAVAKSLAATQYLLKQVEELASNRDMQPAYIQWTATAQSGAPLNAAELHDGWYYIDSFKPNYAKFVVSGIVQCSMDVTQVAPAAPRSVAMAYSGGALTSTYGGGAPTTTNLLTFPLGGTGNENGSGSFSRVAAEGTIGNTPAPVANPSPFVPSATIAQTFKGGVHVYDTINTGSNPVPTSGGTFVNANWVEVFYVDHDFIGDCVVTNGLQLLLFQANTPQIATCYLWNPSLATANWQQYGGALRYFDNATNNGTLRDYSLIRVGAEESSLALTMGTAAGGNLAKIIIRLQRGRLEFRVDVRPLSQSNTNTYLLTFQGGTQPKFFYNEAAVTDTFFGFANLAASVTFGYGAAFINSSAAPYVFGFLYQNAPASQPATDGTANLMLGDTSGPAVGAQRSYGVFATPYGTSGLISPANLQAEAEGGALGTGWSAQVNAAASGGHEAKCASGTLTNNANTFGTAFLPVSGAYDIWFRIKVTSNVGSAAEMTVGLWDASSTIFVPSGSTTLNRNAMTTSYAWYRAATSVVPTAGHNMQFQAVTSLTLGTDWFVDEAVMVPKSIVTSLNGPQEIWESFMFDRSARMVRP